MKKNTQVTRREFIATTSLVLLAADLRGEPGPDSAKLALDGGMKAVTRAMPKPKRWGDPELAQLGEAVKQPSMFYWKNHQAKLLTDRFRKIYGHKYIQPTSSGTAALHIAVAAAGVAPGDEVITTGITDVGTVIGILFQNAVPVFAELDPNTYNLDPVDVERKITPKTKAIIAVHLSGNPCRLNELRTIADKHNLVLIEDCAQAWGAMYQGKPIGTVGHIACFSLQDSKHITCGDGGLVATNDEKFGPLLIPFGDKGVNRINPDLSSMALGANYRMSELQAAFAATQLTRMEGIAAKRSKLGEVLTAALADVPGIAPQKIDASDRCVHYGYMCRLAPEKLSCHRTQFIHALDAEGASFSDGYIARPVYRMPMFQNHSFFAGRWPVRDAGLTTMDYTKVNLPVTDAILTSCMRFSLNEAMDEDYIRNIAQAVRKVAKAYAV